jgi:hypothetical protein
VLYSSQFIFKWNLCQVYIAVRLPMSAITAVNGNTGTGNAITGKAVTGKAVPGNTGCEQSVNRS